jgi:CheY-like chemotaxis protein
MSDSRGTILLVDDDPAILLAVGDKLQFEGYRLVKVASAESAIQELRTLTPDLIILDISMPGIGGMAFLKQISSGDGTTKFPVLVFTARAELDQFFAHTGVDGFLPKTTDPDTLMKEIDHIISKRQAPATQGRATYTAGRRMRVMVAEDDPHKCQRLVNFFTRYGYVAHGVSNSYAVIETAILHNPDVLLVKYIMPHVNGPAIATMLGAMPSTRTIPVVLYDDSMVHDPASKFTNVRTFVPSNDEEPLLKAVEAILAHRAT